MTKDWNNGIICPIFKKENRAKCANYGGIMLLSIPYKFLLIILLKRLDVYSEEILNEYQCGFRNGKGSIDQIFIVRQTMEKCLEFNTDLYLLFIDYRQAVDSLNRSAKNIELINNGVLIK